ncbi:YaaC family protein [Yinghuangia sp. YIM S09857]|uniref:YaaC family protein n=1 Tax=Yinghuangia sp. YIM S09857 TaxID=3436929 RepID=UPI003F5368A3
MVRRPYPTFRDSSYAPTEAVWRALRHLRAAPPGHATQGSRKDMFSAALEQTEQLFAAASTVGPASRPMLLYYAVNQAGRALAACAPVPKPESVLQGHGLVVAKKDQPDIGEVTVQDKGADHSSFLRVAKILKSRTLPAQTRVADLWTAILEVERWPLKASTGTLLHVSLDGLKVDDPTATSLAAIASEMPARLKDAVAPEDRERDVTAWLADYPTLAGYAFRWPGAFRPDGPDHWNARENTIGCRLTWRLDPGETPLSRFDKLAPWKGRSFDGTTRVLHPAFGGHDDQLHPLLAWWAILHALSMMARYQPAQWTVQTDVNKSPDAVALEYLLDKALAAVPDLVLAAIDEVT